MSAAGQDARDSFRNRGCNSDDPRHRPGTTGTTVPRRRRELHRARPRLREFPQIYPAAGLGRARPRRRSGQSVPPRARAARGHRRAATRGRSASPTSARRRVLWDRATGRPVARAIVWQDRRTAERLRRAAAPSTSARAPGSCPVRTSRRRRSVAARASTRPADGARVRHDRHVADLEAHGRRASTRPTSPTRRARCCSTSTTSTGTTSCSSSSACRGCCPRSGRRPATSARACCSARRHADRGHRRRPAGRALRQDCFAPARPRRPTAPAFVLVNIGRRASSDLGLQPMRRSVWTESRDLALEGSLLVTGAAVQWLRDGLAARRRGARPRRWRRRSTTTAASTSSLRSRVSARRGGDTAPAPRFAGSPAAATRAHLVRAALEAARVPNCRRAQRDAEAGPTCALGAA